MLNGEQAYGLPDEVTINGRVYVARDVAAAAPWDVVLTSCQAAFLSDLMAAYPPTTVDRVMGWANGRCARLVQAHRMSCVSVPGSERVKVTPMQVAEFMASCVRSADTS